LRITGVISFLRQHEVAHYHDLIAHGLERDPAAEGETGEQRYTVKRDV
jgi:hypothetical protein